MAMSKAATLMAAMIIFLVLTSQAAQAREQTPGKVVVIVADRSAIAEAEGGADLVKSLVGLGLTLRDGQRTFLFHRYGHPQPWPWAQRWRESRSSESSGNR